MMSSSNPEANICIEAIQPADEPLVPATQNLRSQPPHPQRLGTRPPQRRSATRAHGNSRGPIPKRRHPNHQPTASRYIARRHQRGIVTVPQIGRKQKRLLPITVHEIAHGEILGEIHAKVRQAARSTFYRRCTRWPTWAQVRPARTQRRGVSSRGPVSPLVRARAWILRFRRFSRSAAARRSSRWRLRRALSRPPRVRFTTPSSPTHPLVARRALWHISRTPPSPT